MKAIGIGAKNRKIIHELHQLVELDWVMFANSMTILHHPQELIDFMGQLRNANISIVNSAVFHAGFLIGGDYYDYRLLQPDSDENRRLFDWRNRFFELCRQFNPKPAVACVQFGLAAPGVYSIALDLVYFSGRVVTFGYSKNETVIKIQLVVSKKLNIYGSHNALRAIPAVISIIEQNEPPVSGDVYKNIPLR